MVHRRLTGHYYHVYINPERDIERNAEAVHGITQAFLADKPKFVDIVDEFITFIRDADLVIHNAPFDVGFINHELMRLEKEYQPIDQLCGVIDTLALARRKHPGQQNSLDALCRRYHVDRSNREFHGALIDAELLAQVYLLLTGGQEQLFQFENTLTANTGSTEASIRRLATDRAALKVIRASSEELLAHIAFLEKISTDDLSYRD